MTLILSLATPEIIIQVSDRRLISVSYDGRITKTEDTHNKAVLCDGNMLISYAGVGSYSKLYIDDWLVEILSRVNERTIDKVCDVIKTEATKLFSSMNCSKSKKRHSFVCMVWGIDPVSKRLKPAIFTISNALDDNDNWLPEARDFFEIKGEILSSRKSFLFLPVGAELSEQELSELNISLKHKVKRFADAVDFADALLRTIQQVAARDGSVGETYMITSSPKKYVEKIIKQAVSNNVFGFWVSGDEPNYKNQSFIYLSRGNSDSSIRKTFFFPHIVALNMASRGGMLTIDNN